MHAHTHTHTHIYMHIYTQWAALQVVLVVKHSLPMQETQRGHDRVHTHIDTVAQNLTEVCAFKRAT